MFTRHRRKLRIVFGISDVTLIVIAFEAAYQTRLNLNLGEWGHAIFFLTAPVKALLIGFSALSWVTLGYWLEIYDKLNALHPRVILRNTFRQCLLGAMTVVLFEYSLRLDLSRPLVILFAVYSWILLCLFRLNAGSLTGLLSREFGAAHYVLLVGLGESARRVAELLDPSLGHGVQLLGFLADSDAGELPDKVEVGGREYPAYPLRGLAGLLRNRVIDEVIFAVERDRLAELEDVFLLCDEQGVRTRVLIDFFPHVNSDVYVERLGPAPLLTFSAAPHDEVRLFVKRITDIVLAATALVLLFPFLFAIAVLIRLTSPGPAIFRQIRCGLNGRRFVFYKFRSMCENAEGMKDQVAHLSTRELAMKIPNDPRLTSIGRWLRRFSIDELPQLWNVLKGDMSLVGPRPAIPEEVDQYQGWQRRRIRMRPGLTCLWALAGRDSVDFETWMKMDMEYLDNWSLTLDWRILFFTIPRVISGKGAH
ncbi:MAG: sugar transferase [Acidobacteria bacterium]|nr:sugar transferase [Acidobacteriota bacterium]